MDQDYPLSPKYSRAEIDRANELYDEYPLETVAEKTGIPYGTVQWWRDQGYIESAVDHRSEANRTHDDELVERADYLWDKMPLWKVSNILDVPYETLRNWSKKGWIDTDVTHEGSDGRGKRNRQRARRAAYLVHDEDYLQKEAAEKMGVSAASVSRYLKMYRTGTFVAPERA